MEFNDKILKRKTYILNPEIKLIPAENNDEIIYDYIVKMHKSHNTIDNICPIKDVYEFKKIDNSVFWLISYCDKIVGILNIIYREQTIENTLEIERFYIDEEFRKYQIGTKVVKYLKILSKEKGYDGIIAKVYCDNPAISFYERNGFKTYYRYMIADIED